MADPPAPPSPAVPCSAPGVLRVATYNVHGCVGRDRRRDPGRVAEVIRRIGADVIGLQEVDERHPLPGGRGQAEALAQEGGYRSIFGATVRAVGGAYGNVLLTRHPAVEIRHLDVSVPGAEPRGVLDVIVEAPCGLARVLTTHFGLGLRERHRQTAQLLALLAEAARGPLIVLGDFNEWVPRAATVRRIEAQMGPTPRPRSFPARLPLLPLDRIWVRPRAALRGLQVFADPLAVLASDHLPVYADLDLEGLGGVRIACPRPVKWCMKARRVLGSFLLLTIQILWPACSGDGAVLWAGA